MDVYTAYLNGDLQETVLMQQSDNFIDPLSPKKVLKLNKAIYGLKQAGREWNAKLDHALKADGFSPCLSEICLYRKCTDDVIILVAVYVDDIILASKSMEHINLIKKTLCSSFECVDKGSLRHFIGMNIERNDRLGEISINT